MLLLEALLLPNLFVLLIACCLYVKLLPIDNLVEKSIGSE